jgi:hypothetical protein
MPKLEAHFEKLKTKSGTMSDGKNQITEPNIVKAPCPTCDRKQNATVMGEHTETWSDRHAEIWGQETARILKCNGCNTLFFEIVKVFSEDEDYVFDTRTGMEHGIPAERSSYWPLSTARRRPNWLEDLWDTDGVLKQLLDEVYVGLDSKSRVLAAIGIRTAVDRASELLGIAPSLTFAGKLDGLVNAGFVGANERDFMAVLIDAGSAAAHRAWRPKDEDLQTMMDILESFLQRNFILGGGVADLKNAVPSKPARQAKASTEATVSAETPAQPTSHASTT